MNIEMIVQNTDDGKAYDVSNIVSNIQYDSSMEEDPGKLTFTINNVEGVDCVSEGSPDFF